MKKFKKMKFSVIPLLLGMFLFSCNEDDNIQGRFQEKQLNYISEDLAFKIASNFNYKANFLLKKTKSSNFEKQVREILSVKDENNEIVFHIINYSNSGFLILSADNRVSPVLAYSEDNEFRTNNESYPSGLVEWLSMVKEKVKSVRINNEEQTPALKYEWESLISQSIGKTSELLKEPPIDPNECEDEYEQVGPLLTTTWNQTCGYNDYMPILNCDAGCIYNNRAFAGCVPVAIAQVMKYHNFPTTYNWANMPNSYGTITTASLIYDIHNSISGIIYDCNGTGVDKDYNTAGVFTNHFNYSTAIQSNYNSEIVKDQLGLNRPVILGGGRDAGWWIFHDYADGHMWVCDGFRRSKICMFDDLGNLIGASSYLYFHMNWGWGGYENGWYSFNNFNPGDNAFNYQVKMVYNINP